MEPIGGEWVMEQLSPREIEILRTARSKQRCIFCNHKKEVFEDKNGWRFATYFDGMFLKRND